MKGTGILSYGTWSVYRFTQYSGYIFVGFMLEIYLLLCAFRANMCTTEKEKRESGGHGL